MSNAPPTFDWAGRDPAADLTAALTANNWQQDYDAGITVDAEFSGAVDSFPADPARLGASPKDSPANGTSARAEGTQARTLFRVRSCIIRCTRPRSTPPLFHGTSGSRRLASQRAGQKRSSG